MPANLALFKGTGVVPTFIVGKGEAEAYRRRGATQIIEGGGLCSSRNAAIELAAQEGNVCLQMSVRGTFFPSLLSRFE